MTVRCPLCEQTAGSDIELEDHLATIHADWDPERRPRAAAQRAMPDGLANSPGADPAYVAQLVLWAGEDGGLMVRRYVNRLIAEHSRPDLLAMPDRTFWPYARRTIHDFLVERAAR